MSDLEERDHTSGWCYDGMCEHCEHDWCEHRCHDKPATVNAVTQIVAVYALATWAVIGAAGAIPEAWPDLARWSLTALMALLAGVLAQSVVSGLRGAR